ncbi:DUF6233 domain-containing protein [Streptomyces sp. VB1]|uniref:DUF6233 domain-containing protein n=1 Tax=Streptomyces sp. VB1 TaxID=2986803 RepID=UPI0022421999|nr:DUF6233 domain-containing protein [Streptomyces sp. VB1]UZI33933.1 DUF6233 domain-containing protein [Streptomyces sp. VB1]
MPDEGVPEHPPAAGTSPLEKNRAVEEWLRFQLGQVQKRIRDLEEQERAAQRWKIQQKTATSPPLLHRGDCALYEARVGYIDREQALVAVSMPDIESCEACRPETGLQQE